MYMNKLLRRNILLSVGLCCWCGTITPSQSQTAREITAPGSSVSNLDAPAQANGQVLLADDLANAERLSIRFRGYPDLTGDYRVHPDETVSIPVVGRISVSRLSPAALEKM